LFRIILNKGNDPVIKVKNDIRNERRKAMNLIATKARKHRIGLFSLISYGFAALAFTTPAKAVDEIQVYNAGIAVPGQLTIQQHLNYVALGAKQPPFPGGLVSNGSINGTPEFAYGLTDWWEVGLYLPFAIQDRQFLSDSVKLRTLFVSPHADQRNFFYGVNFEISNTTPKFAQTRFGLEIRPIIGVRNAEWEFIVNPIVDVGFGKYGQADFTPAVRLARKLDKDLFVGLEYYADFGEIGHFGNVTDQQHTIFAVTDFKLGVFDVNLGIGYGLTASSDRLVVKAIVGYAFPAPGGSPDASERAPTGPVNPMSRSTARTASY
jgi:hypothetical protein